MADLQNYLFIDGNYLRRAYEDTMRQFFDQADHRNIDYSVLKSSVGASKAFYYDAIDEEAENAASRREALDAISSLDGFHVREGILSRHKKRQKMVDVRLAVECLSHAFSKNAWHVTLLTGDVDFKPLVDALINQGTHVHVYYEPKSAARALYRAADVAVPIDLKRFWSWSSRRFQMANPIPNDLSTEPDPGAVPPGAQLLVAAGMWRGRKVKLWCNLASQGAVYHSRSTRRRALGDHLRSQ